MNEEKQRMYALKLDGTTALHLDLDGLKCALEMELDNYPDEDIETVEFKVSVRLMTDKEIEDLPEFDGF